MHTKVPCWHVTASEIFQPTFIKNTGQLGYIRKCTGGSWTGKGRYTEDPGDSSALDLFGKISFGCFQMYLETFTNRPGCQLQGERKTQNIQNNKTDSHCSDRTHYISW
jgi:hypothetical protein